MKWIKNYDQLATSPLRKTALEIMGAGLDAIDTEKAIARLVRLDGNRLVIKNQTFDLTRFKRIKVIGFGKASCQAAFALEKILGEKIADGIAIGIAPSACEVIKTYQGSHPYPSYGNVEISQTIMELCKHSTKEDLVLVVVSGGGSALLCWPKEECDQGQMLYHKFLNTGGTIEELNTIRKHISLLKGGGLAKYLYPATVVGLIFSDVPGDDCSLIASGPTYKDITTIADAEKIIQKYALGNLKLNETPKEDKYFKNVRNIPLLSNSDALAAMAERAKGLGKNAKIISSSFYDEPAAIIDKLKKANGDIILAGGEPKIRLPNNTGSGGRNLNLAMQAAKKIKPQELILSFASDGLDNSEAAGAMVDEITLNKIREKKINLDEYISSFDGYNLFKTLDELIITGPTQANVSDLMMLIRD